MKHLVTPRLLMRPFAESDFDDLFCLYSDPEIMRYIPPFRPLTEEETTESLERMIVDFNKSGCCEFAVIERKEKKFIGWCGLQQDENSDLPALCFLFTPDALAKGYAIEALLQMLRTAFSEWGFEKIAALIHSENRTSIHVMEKIGMTYEKRTGSYDKVMVLYSIVKPNAATDSIFEHRHQNSPKLHLHEV